MGVFNESSSKWYPFIDARKIEVRNVKVFIDSAYWEQIKIKNRRYERRKPD